VSLFILDTDHLTLLRSDSPDVMTRALAIPREQLATTVITFEEQMAGWYTQIRKARDVDRLERAYAGLTSVAKTARLIQVLPFSRPAIERYLKLRKKHRRLGKLDLSIAAIVLQHDAILVTRNRQDFEQIEGLQLDDWSGENPTAGE